MTATTTSSSTEEPSRHPAGSDRSPSSNLIVQLTAEMAWEWEKGRRLGAETILARHPELEDKPEAVLELVYEEICLRQQHGESPATTEIISRFPRWRNQLEILLRCHRLLDLDEANSTAAGGLAAPRFPSVGERLGEFALLAELGSGSLGRVFLATQPALADRPVVLKLTPLAAREYLSLARLQHTNIVPLYDVQDDPQRNLRILCMPWFGGATLARILTLLEPIALPQRSGHQLVECLDQVQAGLPIKAATCGPARQFLAQSSYVQAMCWIVACLADALHYVHERGVVHLDIKPSNVLLAEGQPMLLDFHLARAPLQRQEPAPAWLGGTPAYMSPEQQAAVVAVQLGRPLTQAVDARSDIYSLGVLLCEALGFAPAVVGTNQGRERLVLAQAAPGVSRGLLDILARCLRADAAQRYPDAAALATDLRCHLANLPLRGVANRSWRERWQKWRQRRPYRLALLVMAGCVVLASLAVGLVGLAHWRRQIGEAETTLQQGQNDLVQRRYTEASDRFKHARALLAYLPGCGDLKQKLLEQQQLAERGRLAEELHRSVERLRFLDGQHNPAGWGQTLQERCGSLWGVRQSLLAGLEIRGKDLEQQVRLDLLDLAVLWTELRVRLAPPARQREVRLVGLRVLAEAEALLGAHVIVYAERQLLEESLAQADQAAKTKARLARLPVRTAWEHHALGLIRLRQGQTGEAARLFDRAVDLQPDSFWAHFYRAHCAHRLGRPLDAAASLTACIALRQASAERAICYYNRALAFTAAGRDDQALSDYTRALGDDRTLGAAWLNRGVLRYRAKRYEQARADLELALQHQASPAATWYNLALVARARGNLSAARHSLQQALRYDPAYEEAQALLRHLDQQP